LVKKYPKVAPIVFKTVFFNSPSMANSPNGDGVELDGEGGVGDGGHSGHDGLSHVFTLKGGREVTAPGNFWNKKKRFFLKNLFTFSFIHLPIQRRDLRPYKIFKTFLLRKILVFFLLLICAILFT